LFAVTKSRSFYLFWAKKEFSSD